MIMITTLSSFAKTYKLHLTDAMKIIGNLIISIFCKYYKTGKR